MKGFSIGGGKIRKKDLMVVTRQLATLLEAGLPLIRSLRTLERQNKKIGIKTHPPRVSICIAVSNTVNSVSITLYSKAY